MKGTEDVTRKRKTIPQTGRINSVEMSTLPKVIYRFHMILIKVTMAFFTEQEQIILTSVWNPMRPPNGPSYPENEEQG